MNHLLRRRSVPVALACAGLFLAGCAETLKNTEIERTTSDFYEVGIVRSDDEGTPVDGGTLTFGAYSEPGYLDPAQTIVAGSTGGVEMAAIYDTLMQYDTATAEVTTNLAESLESNDDSTVFTLTLPEGVSFSDGSVLDAHAVKWSLERYVEAGADEARLWADNVTAVEAVDDLTVEFTLKSAWPSFPFMLTTGPGMIVGKGSDRDGEFTPIGAGAFTLTRHRPKEEMVLSARTDYWGEAPHLATIRVVYLPDPNALYETLQAGDVDAAFFRDAQVVREAVKAGQPGFMNLVALGNVAVINSREGHPGEDQRVRQAMALAIDPEVVSDRAYAGAGLPTNEVFPSFSRWHSDIGGNDFDPESARKLLDEAKADGYDGKVTYLDASDPASRNTAVAIKALLEGVGFDVELDLVSNVQDQIQKVAIDGNYDVAGWGISWREAGPYGRMFATLHSQGNLTVGMHTSPEMDSLITELQGAEGEDVQRDVMARIQEQWNTDVPALAVGPTPEFLAWNKDVHGVDDSVNSMVLLDQAWMD
ncbi:ABC transporter substrate-binding protein [Nocardioides allogilvus]|uniref:ABC transporter substrate-binding protein n=1 Tax=Nocardioides allogilvus TaxID=2072017 RepID=UPI000D301913|nr:ABC transporter substrate-binding protein [Nocardioides allogilvus]